MRKRHAAEGRETRNPYSRERANGHSQRDIPCVVVMDSGSRNAFKLAQTA
jgi:hypothetical protein